MLFSLPTKPLGSPRMKSGRQATRVRLLISCKFHTRAEWTCRKSVETELVIHSSGYDRGLSRDSSMEAHIQSWPKPDVKIYICPMVWRVWGRHSFLIASSPSSYTSQTNPTTVWLVTIYTWLVGSGLQDYMYNYIHSKRYLVKMTTSAWLQFQGSLNRSVVWLKEFQNTIIIHQPITIPSSFKEIAQTIVGKPTYISSWAII